MSLDPYQQHPRWAELEILCSKIERLKGQSKKLREEIDKDIFAEVEKSEGGNLNGKTK